jgi:hypothetical protein
MPVIDATAAEAMQARRLAMLRRFMAAGRTALRPFIPFRKRKRKGRGWRGKGEASGSGGILKLRIVQNRMAKLGAFLKRLKIVKWRRPTTPARPAKQRTPKTPRRFQP